jgi:hypothetical protein
VFTYGLEIDRVLVGFVKLALDAREHVALRTMCSGKVAGGQLQRD